METVCVERESEFTTLIELLAESFICEHGRQPSAFEVEDLLDNWIKQVEAHSPI